MPRLSLTAGFAKAAKPIRLLTLAALLLVPMLACTARPTAHDRPNILLILADDLGYSDLGCYGGEIRTPNLDALAGDGLRYTQFYNSSRCCPSRASLLTGLYPHQAGIGRFVGNGKLPGYLGHLSDQCVTLAEVLRPAGYSTYAVGKWHVNEPGPTRRGFDGFYGFVHGYAVDSWNPRMMIRLPDDQPARTYAPGEFYATDAITDHALDFLGEAREKDRPWFVYVAYQAAHFPVQAPPELTATYVETYRRGWDAIREDRLAKMKRLGLMPSDLTLPPRSPIDRPDIARRLGSMTQDGLNPAWDTLDADRREDLAHRMAVYAAEVEKMDQNIGRLIVSLRKAGELDNTLIVFTSDNGACAEWEPFGFDLDAKDYANNPPGTGVNGGTPNKPNILHTGEALKTMGGPGSLFSYGCGWANASNTPLSYYKHYAHEGGIRAPMIAHWPARIHDAGATRAQVHHVMDFMASFVDATGAVYPDHLAGRDILAMEGRSLLPSFDNHAEPARTLVYEHERNIALRVGDYKLVAEQGLGPAGLRADARWELYNVKDDPAEQHDLAEQEPGRVRAMMQTLKNEADRTLILPLR